MTNNMPEKFTIQYKSVGELQHEYSGNISKNGLFVKTDRRVELFEFIELVLELPGGEVTVQLSGEVVHVRDHAQAEQSGLDEGFGIQINDLNDDKRKVIEDFIAANQQKSKEPHAEEKREHKRSRTRVKVKFATEGALTAKYANDISHGGIFIQTKEPLPLQAELKVALIHPATGKEMTLKGEVVRHVPDPDGDGFSGMGVSFTDFEDSKELIEKFVNSAAMADAAGVSGGISGKIEELGIENLIQMLCKSSREGRILLKVEGFHGVILFHKGQIVQSYIVPEDEPDDGFPENSILIHDKAFDRILTWHEGEFEYSSIPTAKLADPIWVLPVESALLDVLRQKDEMTELESELHLNEFDAKLYLDVDSAKQAFKDLTPSQKGLVKLINRPKTVEELMDESPMVDLKILESLAALVELNIVSLK